MKSRYGFLLIPFLLLAIGCSGQSSSAPSASANLTPAQANELLQGKNPPQLIDVRNSDEFQSGHIPGAKLIPLPELEKRLGEIDQDRPVLLYCLGGVRSQKAMDLLTRRGFKKLSHIEGGIKAWKESGLPTTTAAP